MSGGRRASRASFPSEHVEPFRGARPAAGSELFFAPPSGRHTSEHSAITKEAPTAPGVTPRFFDDEPTPWGNVSPDASVERRVAEVQGTGSQPDSGRQHPDVSSMRRAVPASRRGPARTIPDDGSFAFDDEDLERTFAQPREPQIERLGVQVRARFGTAADAFQKALTEVWLDPEDGDALGRLEREARRLGCWDELVDAFALLVAAEEDDTRALRLAERAVDWCRVELKDSPRAQPFLDRIGLVDPSHPAVHRRLASQYREKGVFDAERDALHRALLRARNAAEKRQILLRLAAVEEERFQNLDEAARHYDAILGFDGDDPEALRGLERIARIQRRFTKLAMVLEREVDVTRDPQERLGALLRLADLNEHYFLRPHLAAPRLEAALLIDPQNRAALEGLERCYRAARDWNGLANALERLAAAEQDGRAAVGVLLRLAEVQEDKRADVDAAAEAHRRVLSYDPTHKDALTALSRLHERRGEWSAAATYKARLAELAPTSNAAAIIHVSIGDMLSVEGRDPGIAERHYEQAVQLDPTLGSAWDALLRLADARGDQARIADVLRLRAERAPSNRARAQAYVELARYREHKLGDGRGALQAYELAVQADVSNEVAAAALLDELARHERWDDVLRLVDPLVGAAARAGDARRAYQLVAVATRAAFATGDGTKALKYALKAWELRPHDAAVARAVVDVAHRLRKDTRAIQPAKNALRAIATDANALTPSGLVKLAEVQLSLGEAKGALGSYGRALDIDGRHAQALAGVAEIYLARGDFARAADTKQKLARATEDPDAKFRLFVEAAELWSSRVRNPDKAIVALEEARDIKPKDAWVLHALVGAYGDRQQWRKLAVTLRTLASVEDAQERRTKALYALAKLTWKKLREPNTAAQLFEEILDAEPRHPTAFERVVAIYLELGDYRTLAGAYRRMILRLRDVSSPEVDKLKYALFHQLACILRDHLQQPKGALEAFAVASQINPEADADRRHMAELLVSLGDLPKAIATTRERIRRQPLSPDAYRELAELLFRQQEFDRAYSVLDVLSHLGGAGEQHQRFLDDYAPMPLTMVPGTLADGAWASHILHPKLDPTLTTVFRIVTGAVRRARAVTFTAEKQASLGAPLAIGRSPLGDRVFLAFQNASEVLGTGQPILYVKNGMASPIVAVPAHAPALFLALDTLEGLPPDAIPFLAAKHLAELRGELAARAFFRTATELKSLLTTAVRIATGNGGKPLRPSDSAVQLAMSPEERAELRGAVMTLEHRGGSVDLSTWLAYADVSSTRAGLLLSGSVDVAWRGLQHGGMAPSDLPPQERRAELLSFAISDEHAELRDAIGVAVHQR